MNEHADKVTALTVAEIASLGDVVIVLRDAGRSGVAYIRGHKAPSSVTIDYGHKKDDRPLSIRQVTVKVGWARKAWDSAPAETRAAISNGQHWWQEANDVPDA